MWSASSLIEKSKRWFASKAKKTSFVTVVYDPHTVGARTLLSMARELCFGVRVAPGVLPPEMVIQLSFSRGLLDFPFFFPSRVIGIQARNARSIPSFILLCTRRAYGRMACLCPAIVGSVVCSVRIR